MITDFHTHILPNMDDGAVDAAQSLAMLRAMADQEVEAAVATPHFYPTKEDPALFLQRRAEAVARLQAAAEGENGLPTVYVGAEVAFFVGISSYEHIERLCIDGTRCILIEMPFSGWTDSTVKEILRLKDKGLQPIIAHIERYPYKREQLGELIAARVLVQSNTSNFNGFFSRRKAIGMMMGGAIHLLGSDCHNMSDRSPDLLSARDRIEAVDEELCERADQMAKWLLKSGRPIL